MVYPTTLSAEPVKVRCTLQYDATECGPAALSSLLGYFGCFQPIKLLRERCSVDRSGTTALKLVKAAESFGLTSRPYTCSADELRQKGQFPCIVYWGFEHYLVVEGFKDDKALLCDPDKGRHSLPFKDFQDYFTGVVLELKPGPDFKSGGTRERPVLDLLPLFVPFAKPLGTLALVASLIAIPTFAIAALTSQYVDAFLENQRYYFGIPIVWLSVFSIALSILFYQIQYILLRRIELVFSRQLTTHLFYRLFSSPLAFYQQRLQGELASRMLIGLQMTQLLIQQTLRQFASIWTSLLLLVLAIFLSPALALLAVVSLTANIVFNILLSKSREDDNKKYALEEGKTSGLALQGISNIETIKSSGSEFDFLDTWQAAFDEVQHQFQKLGSQIGFSTVAASTSNYLLNAFTLILGGFLILLGWLSLGELTAFQFIQAQIIAPISIIPNLTQSFQTMQGMAGRIRDLLSVDPDPLARGLDFLDPEYGVVRESSSSRAEPFRPGEDAITGNLSLQAIGFQYSSKSPFTFQNLSLNIEAGKKISIVGPTGCGKSTLIRLIAGMAQPTEGQLCLDGRPYSAYPNVLLRDAIAYVPQDVFCFNASIWDNIACWQPGFDRDQIIAAAQAACIHETVISHPEGYGRILRDNGADLSGGQRQRLEIARALLRTPKVMLLDEATSALDNQTESDVLQSVWSRGITTIMIAHRIASAMHSDEVIVLNGGVIEASGPPSELRKHDGLFKDLYEREMLVQS